MSQSTTTARSGNINIRVSPDTLGLIDQAARVFGKTRSSFILDTVRQAAEDAIMDQRLFLLNPEQWSAFTALLDAPLRENAGFTALLQRKSAWEA